MMPGMMGGAQGGMMQPQKPYDPTQELMKKSINQLSELMNNDMMQAYQKGMAVPQPLQALVKMLPMQQAQAQGPQQPQNGSGPQQAPPQQPPPGGPGAVKKDEQAQPPQEPGNVAPGAPMTQNQAPGPIPSPVAPLAEAVLGNQVMQPPTPVAPTTPQYQVPGMLPATGPFGTAQIGQDGSVRQAGVFGSLFAPAASTLLAQQGQAIQNVQGMQEIRGDKPLQAGEREKQRMIGEQSLATAKAERSGKLAEKDLERRDKFYESLDTPVSSESSRSLTFAGEIVDTSKQLLDVLEKNPNAMKSINAPGNPFGQKLKVTISRLEQAMLRYASGATITKEEKAEIREILPKIGMKAWLQDPTTAKFELTNAMNRFGQTKELLDPKSNLRTEIKTLEKAGFTREDIWDYMKHKERV